MLAPWSSWRGFGALLDVEDGVGLEAQCSVAVAPEGAEARNDMVVRPVRYQDMSTMPNMPFGAVDNDEIAHGVLLRSFFGSLQVARQSHYFTVATVIHHHAGLRHGDDVTVMASRQLSVSSMGPRRAIFLSPLRWTAPITREMSFRTLFDILRRPPAWLRRSPASTGSETSELVATGRVADANAAELRASHIHSDEASVQISAQVTGYQGEEAASSVGRVVGDPESTPQAWRRDLAIVDGMDVMRWEGGVPELDALRAVIDLL